MLKILKARLQQYMNHELPDVQTGFRKGRGTRDQIANIRWIMEKAREFQKSIYFCFIDYAKAFVKITISSVQFSRSVMSDSLRPHELQHHQLLEFTRTHVHLVSDAIQPSHPLSSPSPPALNPSQHQGLSNESTLRMRWPKYWSFSFSIIPAKEHPGLISFRMDCKW